MIDFDFAFSPCPNDTFAFHALVHGLIPGALTLRPQLLDIEELNRRALRGEFPVTKVSFGVLPRLLDRYQLLNAGAALGFGCGPLLVSRTPMTLQDAAERSVAIPGFDTTAFLLMRLAVGKIARPREMRYDQILACVENGQADLGLIIHESRFTYEAHGLLKVADLGEWWEGETGLPIPLGAIVARRDLRSETLAAIDRSIRSSVDFAFAHPDASRAYVRANAQEMSDDVCNKHIALYVNEFTRDLGERGRAAVEALLGRAQ